MAQKESSGFSKEVNTWTNEFGDRIMFTGSVFDKGGMVNNYRVVIDGKYLQAVGSLNVAKGVINKSRAVKCKYTATRE